MTIVGGIAGSLIGAYFGGPLGAKWGWSIGTIIGGLLEGGSKSVRSEVGRMDDLTYSASTYGASIPHVWGEAPVPANIIWMAHYLNGSPVPTGTADAITYVEHQSTVGGGGGFSGDIGGGNEQVQISYSMTCMISLAVGSFMNVDGNFVNRNVQLRKLYANGELIWEEGAANNKADIVTYSGSNTDIIDPTVEAFEGAGNTPAFRGQFKILLNDYNFGSTPPTFSAQVYTDAVVDGDIYEDLLSMAIPASNIDTTDCVTNVLGFKLTSSATVTDTLKNLTSILLKDIVEYDGKIKVLSRGRAVSATILDSELGAGIETGTIKYTLIRQNPTEVPKIVELSFLDPSNDFNTTTVRAIKQYSTSETTISMAMDISLSVADATKLVNSLLDVAYVEQNSWEMSIPFKYLYLIPACTLYAPVGVDNELERLRILSMEIGSFGEIRIKAVSDREEALTQIITGAGGSSTVISNTVAVPTDFKVWSGKELRKEHRASAGFYVAANGSNKWKGCTVYYSLDSGTSWVAGGRITYRSTFGNALTSLANGVTANVFEPLTNVNVELDYGSFATVLEDEVLAGENHIVQWDNTAVNNANLEIYGFTDATLIGTLQYTLGNLKRGELGSGMTGHTSDDNIVLASTGICRVEIAEDYVGSAVLVRCVSPLQTLASADVISRQQSVTIIARTPESIDLGGSITDGTAKSVLFISSDLKLTEDNPNFIYDPLVPALYAPNLYDASLTTNGMLYSGASGHILSTASPTNGQLLVGRTGTNPVLATLTGTNNQITVTNASGSITLSTPQDIATSSSPTFNKLTLSGTGSGNGLVVSDCLLYRASADNWRFADYVAVGGPTFTSTSATQANIDSSVTFTPSGATSGRLWSLKFTVTATGANNFTDNTSSIVGLEGTIVNNSTGTMTAASCGIFFNTLGANSITSRLTGLDVYGADVSGSGSVGATVTDFANIIVRNPRSSGNTSLGNVTNAWGIQLRAATWSGTGHTANQYFIGPYTGQGMLAITANSQSRIFMDIPAMPNPGAFTGTTVAGIRFASGSTYRDGILWGTDVQLYRSAATTLYTNGKFECVSLKVGTSSTANSQALVASDANGNVTFQTVVTKHQVNMVLCSGFTPSGTGADVAEITVPYSPADGTTSKTYNVRRIDFRVNVAGGAPSITLEKYTGTSAFSATSIGTVTLGSGAYEGNKTSSFTTSTLTSGDKVRFNVGTLGTATGWTIQLLLEVTT